MLKNKKLWEVCFILSGWEETGINKKNVSIFMKKLADCVEFLLEKGKLIDHLKKHSTFSN